MLSPELLSEDLRCMCKMIDELALLNVLGEARDANNLVIYECLAYIN